MDAAKALDQVLVLLEDNQHEAACDMVKKSADKYADFLQFLNNLACRLLTEGQFGEAEILLKLSLSASPESVSIRNNLAYLHLELGDHDKAIKEFKHILNLFPDDVESRCNLGLVYLRAGRTDEAIAEYDRLIADSVPVPTEVYNNLGCAYRNRGDMESSENAFLVALNQNPEDLEVLNNVGCLYMHLSRYQEAQEHLFRCDELSHYNDSDVAWNLALSYARDDKINQARHVFQRCLQLDVSDERCDEIETWLAEHGGSA